MEVWFMDVSWWKKTTPNYQLIQREVAPVEGTWTPSTQKSMRNVRKTPDGFRKIGDTKKMVTLRCWQVPHNKQDYKLHVGGWTNPFEGYLILVYISQTRSFPQSEHEKYSKPPPRLLWSLAVVSALDPLRSLPHKKNAHIPHSSTTFTLGLIMAVPSDLYWPPFYNCHNRIWW